ncbi:MAG: hypothetical protein M1308_09245 [Actinobacteria bacterium]|nr:hypothetical protein [Actinomycetota bacterium]
MNQAKLGDIDIRNTRCPEGFVIEIEGYNRLPMDINPVSLLIAICHGYYIVTGIFVSNQVEFLKRITVLEFDENKKFIKVRIAAP